jgi:hypothetical protein
LIQKRHRSRVSAAASCPCPWRKRDHRTIHAGLKDFILPLVEIRNRKKGYAVSIIKAA